MNRPMLNRLKKLEKSIGINQDRKKAIIIFDSDDVQTFDTSQVDADCVVILPAKKNDEEKVFKNSFQI